MRQDTARGLEDRKEAGNKRRAYKLVSSELEGSLERPNWHLLKMEV